MEDADPLREAARLIATQTWCALGTVDETGVPLVTYAPFAPVDGAFAIAVTRLAAHTVNLLARRPASLMLVDEAFHEGDAYARPRFTVAVSARPNAPGSAHAEAIWPALAARHGGTVDTLRMLPDFTPVSLEPLSGRLVLGFASAHDVAGPAIAELLRKAAG